MKFPPCLTLSVVFLFANLTFLFAQREIFTEDFESYQVGKSLPGQGLWQKSHITLGNVIVGEEGGRRLAESATGDNEFCQIDSLPFHLVSDTKVTVEFDMYLDSEQGSVAVGIGPDGAVPSFVGTVAGVLCIREPQWGDGMHAYTTAGSAYRPTPTKWLRVKSTWNLGDNDGKGSATLSIKPVDEDDSSYEPMYFDKTLTQEAAPLGIQEQWPVNIWSRVWFRIADAKIDNIRITAE